MDNKIPSINLCEIIEEGDDKKENKPPPKKRKKKHSPFDDEKRTCSICFEPWASTGKHRICCLKCGHLFGQKCIERWIQERKACPVCNAVARKNDIRPLYFSKVTVVDSSAKEEVEKRLEEEISKRKKVESERNSLLVQVQILKSRLEMMSERRQPLPRQITTTKAAISAAPCNKGWAPASASDHLSVEEMGNRQPTVYSGNPFEIFDHHKSSQPVACGQSAQQYHQFQPSELKGGSYSDSTSSKKGSAVADGMPKFHPWHRLRVEGGRVLAFGGARSGAGLALVSARTTAAPAAAAAGHGLLKMSLLDPRYTEPIAIHSQPIRDVKYSPFPGSDLFLTTAFDRKLAVTGARTGRPVLTYDAAGPGWSCAWGAREHQIFTGLANGTLCAFDMRKTGHCLWTEQVCRQPLHSTIYYKDHIFTAAMGGVFATHISSSRSTTKMNLDGACTSLSLISSPSQDRPLCLASLRGGSGGVDRATHTLFVPALGLASGGEGEGGGGKGEPPAPPRPPAAARCEVVARLQGHQSKSILSKSAIWGFFNCSEGSSQEKKKIDLQNIFVGSGDELTNRSLVWCRRSAAQTDEGGGSGTGFEPVRLTAHSAPVLDFKVCHLSPGSADVGVLASSTLEQSLPWSNGGGGMVVGSASEKECYFYKAEDVIVGA